MIVVRDIFQLHFSKAHEAVTLAKKMRVIEHAAGYPVARILTDVMGEYHTLVTKSTFENFTEHETGSARARKIRDGVSFTPPGCFPEGLELEGIVDQSRSSDVHSTRHVLTAQRHTAITLYFTTLGIRHRRYSA